MAVKFDPLLGKVRVADISDRLYPDDRALSVMRIYGTNKDILDGFDYTDSPLNHGWSWAGSPFYSLDFSETYPVTDTITTGFPSNITFITTGNGKRHFLYRSGQPSGHVQALVGFATLRSGGRIGVRVDDGTDNNYVETGLTIDSSGNVVLYIEYRKGGGTPTTSTGSSFSSPHPFLIKLAIAGTKWSSWTSSLWYLFPYGTSLPIQKRSLSATTMSWTPRRYGVIQKEHSGSGVLYSTVDVFYDDL